MKNHLMNKLLAVLFLSFTLLVNFTYAAQPQITPQQIEQFKRLSPAQQQMMAKSLGIDINALKQQMMLGNSNENDQQNPLDNVVYPRGTQFDAFGNPIDENSDDDEEEKDSEDTSPKPFGYDVFANAPATFAPNLDIAVPEEHIIGSGDKIKIQIFGKENNNYDVVVNREGQVVIPTIGAVDVAGLSFAELKSLLKTKIKQSIIGVDAVIGLSELRSIRVFVAGDAYKPGPYTLSSLSTITHALFAAGGIDDIGSLRNIQLKRAGKLVATFDLYELLIQGDSSHDLSLKSGDVIFVAPVGKTVTVDGEVRRPAIYELKNNESFTDIVNMAGGLLPSAYPQTSIVERYNQNNLRTIINVDLSKPKQASAKVHAGDYIRIMATAKMFEQSVTVIGAATRPGNYQWHQGDKISHLFPSISSALLANADLTYSLLVREKDAARNIAVYQFSLAKIINQPNDKSNLQLKPRDKIIVFSKVEKVAEEKQVLDELAYTQQDLAEKEKQQAKDNYKEQLFWLKYDADKAKQALKEQDDQQANELINQSIAEITGTDVKKELDIRELGLFSRQRLLLPIITQLKRQGSAGQPIQLVEVDGQVKFPSIYPLPVNGRVSDLIVAAGGVTESAYLTRAEITRNIVSEQGVEKRSLNINLKRALTHNVDSDIQLQSKDRLNIHKIPAWSENHTVELRGEFKFPGKYTIRRGETLAEIIEKAGGVTDFAYVEGSVFTRKKLKTLEQQNLLKLAADLRLEIASKSLTDNSNNLSYKEAKLLLADLTKTTPVGRLVIDLPKVINDNSYDINLDDGDVLYIPSKNNSVNVIGQVQVTSSHIFDKHLTVDDYIARSGGVKKRADSSRIYVISANGSIKVAKQSSWFSINNNDLLKPGDTIVVPLDAEYTDNLSLWASATQIIYNSAVAIAAIRGL